MGCQCIEYLFVSVGGESDNQYIRFLYQCLGVQCYFGNELVVKCSRGVYVFLFVVAAAAAAVVVDAIELVVVVVVIVVVVVAVAVVVFRLFPGASVFQRVQEIPEVPGLPDVVAYLVQDPRHGDHVKEYPGVAGDQKQIRPEHLPDYHRQRSKDGRHPGVEKRGVDDHRKLAPVPPYQAGKVETEQRHQCHGEEGEKDGHRDGAVGVFEEGLVPDEVHQGGPSREADRVVVADDVEVDDDAQYQQAQGKHPCADHQDGRPDQRLVEFVVLVQARFARPAPSRSPVDEAKGQGPCPVGQEGHDEGENENSRCDRRRDHVHEDRQVRGRLRTLVVVGHCRVLDRQQDAHTRHDDADAVPLVEFLAVPVAPDDANGSD
mmetsp:Transcript_34305/g.71802  ORF Transcript_34305/g.71802 Transcript_34305/m.71802 type:complete len:375 (-) Transcript_34305:315-1439(-)